MELTEPVHDRIVILPRRAGIHPEANRVDVIVISWTGLDSRGTQGQTHRFYPTRVLRMAR
ncbi:MAG: hypothetical protein ABSH29_15100 [Acidimicrobiales bacterium]|jgi:hypothetical protein